MGSAEEYEGRTGASGAKETNQDNVTAVGECSSLVVKSRHQRKDTGRLHAVRHAVLSRYPLEALRHLGEDVKCLRRLERRFRTELKPQGAIAEVVFDRFWSSYLRCLLAGRAEMNVFLRQGQARGSGNVTATLLGGDLPTLVMDQGTQAGSPRPLSAETLHELALVQRYDRHFAKEMYAALALLLILRKRGEGGLEEALAANFGIGG